MASSDLPLVSVVVPTYNRADVLPRALASALGQTYENVEVIVVDDGSTDDTEAVVAAVADPRVRYLQQPENRGVSAARNRGLREARGEYVALLDSDDEWFPHKLERQVGLFRESPEDVGLVYGGAVDVDGRGGRRVRLPRHRGDVHGELLLRNVIHGTSGVILRRSAAEAAGAFDEEIPAIEDYDYWIRLTRRYRVDFVEEPLIRYHDPRHEEAERLSLDTEANHAARARLYRKHRADMKRAGVAHAFLLESARRLLRSGPDGPRRARPLLVKAAFLAPTSPDVMRLLAHVLLPEWVRAALRGVRRRLNRQARSV